ncbi:hypothetical protein FO519_009615 [Halicephalobus sp. NKZ332]|nr:hypothetical protein FO519_009615 [Halicephalobus sp. NKZ332]
MAPRRKTRSTKEGSDDNGQLSTDQLARRQKQAKSALEKYHRLSEEEKKALNKKRTLRQKRIRQQKKELTELESILRASKDIVDLPTKSSRRSSVKSPENVPDQNERNISEGNSNQKEKEVPKNSIQKEKNKRKALRARIRYHNMTSEEKQKHNQKRSESLRRIREEEQSLLEKPIGDVKGEDIDRLQEIMSRKARTARNARLAYQRMTPEERKAHNQKRKKYYIPKRDSKNEDSPNPESNSDSC